MKKYIIPVITGALFFLWLYTMDFSNFYLPISAVEELYAYTSLFFMIGLIPVAYLRSLDRKSSAVRSPLRNALRIVLGSLWIIDGILQMQPQMPFGFSHFVLQPSVQSLPLFIFRPLSGLPALWNSSEIVFDSIASSVQLFLGVALLISVSERSVRAAAFLSLLWAIVIWILAEGMGGLFQPGLSLLSGFPGAALLYVMISVMLISRVGDYRLHSSMRTVFILLFFIGVVIQVVPQEGFWSGSGVSSIPGAFIIATQPALLANTLLAVARTMASGIILWNSVFSVLFLLLGLLWALRPGKGAVMTLVIMPAFWFIGQDFGVFGMYGTDPNTGLPIMLLSIVYLMFASGKPLGSTEKRQHTLEADTVRSL